MYRVQLKQGSRTIVNHLEADSWEDIKAFYEAVSTMRVTEILEVKYQYQGDTIPIDDFNYKKLYKGYIRNSEQRISRQIILHNIKKSISTNDLYPLIKKYLRINGFKVDGIHTNLFKM